MIRIVEEKIESCINFIESGEHRRRWYVIKEPICEGGFCKGPFYTKTDAEEYIEEYMKKMQQESPPA